MILGTGIDIIEVQRVASSVERFGERFMRRILLPDEMEYCQRQARSAPHIAARFAAKEAISKAFGTGIGGRLGWHDMEIRRKESGEPYVVMHGKGAELLSERRGRMVHVSLSHTEGYAAAMAVLEGVG
jgi:holo-[acyl-carrier protein] synthase